MSVYKIFPQANLIREWDKLLKMKRDEVVSLYEEWKQIHQENEVKRIEMYTKNNEEIDEVTTFLKAKGVDVFKYKRKGFFPEKNGYKAWFKNNVVDEISKKYPSYNKGIPTAHMGGYEVNGIELYNNQSPTNLVELYDRMTWQYNSKLREKSKKDRLLIKSIEYANEHDIDIEDLSPKAIIQAVSELAKDKYREEEIPYGTDVYLKHECDECSSYIVGEHRCSCGNRRISICVEGDIIEGFYYYPEAN